MKIIILLLIVTNDKINKGEDLLPNVKKVSEKSYVLDKIVYKLFSRNVSWYEAKQACLTYGKFGHLGIIDTKRKQNFLSKLLSESDLYADNIWINWNKSNETYKDDKLNNTCKSFIGSQQRNEQFQLVDCTVKHSYLCERDLQKTFVLDEIEYIASSNKVNWYEANTSCSTNGQFSQLVVIDTEKKNFFLTKMLLGFYLYAHNYIWINLNQLNNTYENHKLSNVCRSFLASPKPDEQFQLVNCSLKTFYLCQSETKKLNSINWIPVKKYIFAIINEKVTWKEAANRCFYKYNAHLADFQSTYQIQIFLTKGGFKQIDAWVGAYYKYDHWRYLTTGETVYENRFIRSGIMIQKKKIDTNCLTLRIDQTLFPAKCSLKKRYICARGNVISKKRFYNDGVCYIIFLRRSNWIDAQKLCRKSHSWLVELTTNKKVVDVLSILNYLPVAMRYIWIGSKFSKTRKWMWTRNKTSVQLKNFEVSKKQKNNRCLSIDKESKPLHVYANLCSDEQYFICEKENSTELGCMRESHGYGIDFDIFIPEKSGNIFNKSLGTTLYLKEQAIEADFDDLSYRYGAYIGNGSNHDFVNSIISNNHKVVKGKVTSLSNIIEKSTESVRLQRDTTTVSTIQGSVQTSTPDYDNNQLFSSNTNTLIFNKKEKKFTELKKLQKNKISLQCSKFVKDVFTDSLPTFKRIFKTTLDFICCWITNILNEYVYIKQSFLTDLLSNCKNLLVVATKRLFEILINLVNYQTF